MLMGNMTRLKAEEILQEHGAKLSNKSVKALTLAVTGDEKKADRARAERMLAEMEAGITPEV